MRLRNPRPVILSGPIQRACRGAAGVGEGCPRARGTVRIPVWDFHWSPWVGFRVVLRRKT